MPFSKAGAINRLAQRKAGKKAKVRIGGAGTAPDGAHVRGWQKPGRTMPPGLARLQAAGRGPFKSGGPFAGTSPSTARPTDLAPSTPAAPAAPGSAALPSGNAEAARRRKLQRRGVGSSRMP
jgi:hypothetical protein